MLDIAVCDDELIEIEYLSSLTKEWARSTETLINISEFTSAESFLFKYEEDKSFDILLLDIQMKSMDGIELAEKIRETDKGVQIVFVTGFSDYISKGYDVCALHYLIKPVEKDKFFEVLTKAKSNLNKSEKYILVSVDDESVKLNLKDIFYIEAFGHYCSISCGEKQFKVKLSISDIKAQLDDSFITCHRSYIANLAHISRITKTDIIFDNGKNIPVSRRMYNDVNSAFIKFYRGTNK